MLGKENSRNKPVPLGKNWHVNFLTNIEMQARTFASLGRG